MSEHIAERVKILTDELYEHLKDFNAEELDAIGTPLNSLREDIRETIQRHLQEPAERLIKKLRHDEPLTAEEIKVIERWVVGDAEEYTKMENNLIDWVGECKRLCSILGKYTYEDVEGDDTKLLALGAILTDLKYTLDDVIHYAEELNRVDRFKETIGAGKLDKETKEWLGEMIGGQIVSDEY